MTRRQSFVYRHPMVTLLVILAVELLLLAVLHLALGWSLLAIMLAGLVVLALVALLMG